MKKFFRIYCENGAIIAVDTIMQKTCGLVVIGRVKNEDVSEGEIVAIKNDAKHSIFDKIKRIEIDGEKITVAKEGQLIGLCLDSTSKEDIVEYLN